MSRVLPLPSPTEQSALVASLARERLRAFRRVVNGSDRLAIELYVLDAAIASEFHSVVRSLEILLRENMHRALAQRFGANWYQVLHAQLDLRTRKDITKARNQVGWSAPPGKVVAQMMFGAWTGLLDAGGALSDASGAQLADYEQLLWSTALTNAFTSPTSVALERRDVHSLAQTVHWARNRINHCEPLVFGFPQPGQSTVSGVQARKTPARVLKDAQQLLLLLNPDVSAWMSKWDTLDRLLVEPLAQQALASPPAGVQLVH